MPHSASGGDPAVAPTPPPRINRIGLDDLNAALSAGMRDFARAPLHGLFFASFFVVGGLLLAVELERLDQSYSIIPLAFGFPLLAPFFAMGLYDVSRRLERGEPLRLPNVLRVVYRQKDRQCPSMAAVVVVIFLFWIFIAHMIFALFLGLAPMTNISTEWQTTFFSPEGIRMLLFGTAVGAGFAFVVFGITAMGLPLLLDREVDFITAMICSWQAVTQNLTVMLPWGVFIAVTMLAGMLPFFLGLFVVLPVLGHATWHLYRRTLLFEPDPEA